MCDPEVAGMVMEEFPYLNCNQTAIEANADYFLELDIESLAPDDFVYSGVRYDYSPANVKGTVIEAGVQITGNPGNSQISSKTIDPVVLSSIAAGIFLAGALVYDKKRKRKVDH